MEYINNINIEQQKPSAVTLGNFDGFHLGHQKLMNQVISQGELKSIVFSFAPHPLAVLQQIEMKSIFTAEEKLAILEHSGLDVLVEYPFTMDFSNTTPEDFMVHIISEKLKCRYLVVGEGYRFGKSKMGDTKTLTEIGTRLGIEVVIMPLYVIREVKVSSTHIRQLINQGDVAQANLLLGRRYFLMGFVELGKKLGRTIGFPTINVIAPDTKLLPPNGVYITMVYVKEYGYLKGITNIGMNPTVNGQIKMVETFLFDFNEDLYGRQVKIEFIQWLRPEKKFDSIESLKEQIKIDTANAFVYFQENKVD